MTHSELDRRYREAHKDDPVYKAKQAAKNKARREKEKAQKAAKAKDKEKKK